MALLLVPATLTASSFEGKLFYSLVQREAIDQWLESASELSVVTPPESSATRKKTVTNAKTLLLSFDGVMGDGDLTRLWINRQLWTDASAIKGVRGVRLIHGLEQLLVTLDSGRELVLKVGHCLLINSRSVPCASLANEG